MDKDNQGFSRLNLQPESKILTKFADVKSRMYWTPERRELLGVMWNRGDKASDVAAALGCKVGAINVARARFGLKPRRVVSGRPKEPDEPAHKIERVAFTTSRLMEFSTEKELRAQTGHETYKWPLVIVKELVDNGIDACEAAKVAPVIKVTITTGTAKEPTRIVIEDNGPGIPSETIDGVIDYNFRVSSNEAYISPTRGRQGNALKTILPMAYVLDGKQSETLIEARGLKHRILFSVNQIKQEPIVKVLRNASRVKNGTRITVLWPETAKINSPEVDWDDYGGSWEEYQALKASSKAKIDHGKLRDLLSSYIWCNPHLTLTFVVDGKTLVNHNATDPGWSKYRSCDATSAHWYGLAEIERYAGALIGRDQERPKDGREKITVRDFIAQFRGMRATSKQKEILGELGVSHTSLHRFFGSETEVNHKRMKALLRLLQKHTRPVRPELLGVLGAEHLRRMVLAAGGEPNPNSFKYFAFPELKDGMPEIVEIAVCPYKAWVAGGNTRTDRMLVTGVNFSATLENPFDTMKDLEGLTEMLVDLKAGESAPIIVCVHYACPQIEYLDRGKSRIALE
jgi:hypothetical protein